VACLLALPAEIRFVIAESYEEHKILKYRSRKMSSGSALSLSQQECLTQKIASAQLGQ